MLAHYTDIKTIKVSKTQIVIVFVESKEPPITFQMSTLRKYLAHGAGSPAYSTNFFAKHIKYLTYQRRSSLYNPGGTINPVRAFHS